MSKLFILAFVLGCSVGCCFANCAVYAAGRKIFKTYDNFQSVPSAKTACEEKGGMLAMPKDKEQVTFLHALDNSIMWIGGTKDGNGNWMWVDGTEMPLTQETGGVWYQGTHGDGPSGNGNCLQIGWEGAVWDDVECGSNRHYSCEYKLKADSKKKMMGDRFVEKFDVEETYFKANASCSDGGGHLITDNNDEVHAWLTHDTREYWIGATDYGTEGTWRWESGKAFSPDHWIEGGPDNALYAEHCATINRNTPTWEDNYCGESHYYACEYYFCPDVEEKKVLKSKKKFSLKLKH